MSANSVEGKKHVSEIFGYPITNDRPEVLKIREKCLCPFQTVGKMEKECDPVNKKSNLTDDNGKLLLTHQTGACSVFYTHAKSNTVPVIVCPNRFYEQENDQIRAFEFIQRNFFPKKTLRFVPEIGLGKYGRADWMICEINKDSKIIDYNHLEIQSDATTGTEGLVLSVKDFFDGKDISKKQYQYGMNSKASIKGSSLQMIDKGFLFEKLKKKSIFGR